MDKQGYQALVDRLRERLQTDAPRPMLVYGRRLAPAAGFSLTELDEAGLSESEARGLGLPVDAERMSSLGTNVENLKRFLG